MKKFISMIIALSMLLSLCGITVYAATSEHPTINVYAETLDVEDTSSSWYKPDECDVYKISYTTSGIDTSVDKIGVLQLRFSIDDATKIAAKTWQTQKKNNPKDYRGFLNYGAIEEAPYNVSEGLYLWQNEEDGIDAYDYETYGDTGGTEETLPLAETLIYVAAGETVSFTYLTALKNAQGDPNTQIKVIAKDDDTDIRKYNTAVQYNIVAGDGTSASGNVLTLGSSGGGGANYVTDIDLSENELALTVGGTQTLTATLTPNDPDDSSITWSSSDTDVAIVSSAGVVTAVAAGTATIKAEANGDDPSGTPVEAACTVTVSAAPDPVNSVSINGAATKEVILGNTLALSATVDPALSGTVTWSSSNDAVATVSSTGVVTPVAAGSVTITASAGTTPRTDTCTVTVLAHDDPVSADTVNVAKPSETYLNNKTGIVNINGDPVKLTKNYKPALFKDATLDEGLKRYFLRITDDAEKTIDAPINFAAQGIEAGGGSFDFVAIVKSATHVITAIQLIAVDR